MTGWRVARSLVLPFAASLLALCVVNQAEAQPAPAPPPLPTASASAAQPLPPPPPPEAVPPAPPVVATSPDDMPTSQAPLMQAPPPLPPQPLVSPPRDKRGNLYEGRPTRLPWLPGEVVPPGYEPISGPSKRFLISGMIVGGAPYLGSFIGAYVAAIKGDGDAWGALFAPAVGPFIAIETGGAENVGAYLLILDGLAQTTGIALTIVAFVTKDHTLKRKREAPNVPPAPIVTGDIGPTGASLKVEF
jgi:hypothetical protein